MKPKPRYYVDGDRIGYLDSKGNKNLDADPMYILEKLENGYLCSMDKPKPVVFLPLYVPNIFIREKGG